MRESIHTAAKKPEASKNVNSVCKVRKVDMSPSVNSPADQIFFLQRTIGNQVVQRLFKSGVIQAKLKIGQPNDIYEREADRVADEVMRMPENTAINCQPSVVRKDDESVQTKPILASGCSSCREKEELVQTKEITGKTSEITPNTGSRIYIPRQSVFAVLYRLYNHC